METSIETDLDREQAYNNQHSSAARFTIKGKCSYKGIISQRTLLSTLLLGKMSRSSLPMYNEKCDRQIDIVRISKEEQVPFIVPVLACVCEKYEQL